MKPNCCVPTSFWGLQGCVSSQDPATAFTTQSLQSPNGPRSAVLFGSQWVSCEGKRSLTPPPHILSWARPGGVLGTIWFLFSGSCGPGAAGRPCGAPVPSSPSPPRPAPPGRPLPPLPAPLLAPAPGPAPAPLQAPPPSRRPRPPARRRLPSGDSGPAPPRGGGASRLAAGPWGDGAGRGGVGRGGRCRGGRREL